ncbi:single-stranded DNA-binding protein [Ancylothrix sp. C2]|uniref:single-stranded DNA-binding protein n=1 Tax=Ancylothrix sp. D3o TaxID=2953691 RepID=UPI0021BB8C3B|nr:single-stranded DNA-binding protein [Ancylothrix sp. D3o]MCT7951792.1 single-stranded DNA-binding protein [Ancylothrix sp. D3o]
MNSCILMAEILQNPQLRYTPDQIAIAEMFVQFPALKAEDKPSTLKVVGWGNLAQEIQERYHQGDRVLIEGRLGMITVTLADGVKEKRAELTASRIHNLGAGGVEFSSHVAQRAPETVSMAAPAPSNVVQMSPRAAVPAPKITEPAPNSTPSQEWQYTAQPEPNPRQSETLRSDSDSSLDDIPF